MRSSQGNSNRFGLASGHPASRSQFRSWHFHTAPPTQTRELFIACTHFHTSRPSQSTTLCDTNIFTNIPSHTAHHAWCLSTRCPSGQVHQRLRCFLEASGQAAHPRSVSHNENQCAQARTQQYFAARVEMGRLWTIVAYVSTMTLEARYLNPVRNGGLHVGNTMIANMVYRLD